MKKLLLLIACLLVALPAIAQAPPVGRVTSDPSGQACTSPPAYNLYPLLYRNTGTTTLWYFCASGTSTYQVVGTGAGDMLKSAYDPDSLGGAKVVTHATACDANVTCDAGATSYLCVDLDDGAAWICDGSSWVSSGGGGAGDMLKGTYDADDNGVVDGADSIDWSDVANIPAEIADGDADTTIADGLTPSGLQAIRRNAGDTAYEPFTPNQCLVGENACNLNASTTVGGTAVCLEDTTGCPSGVTDTTCNTGDQVCTIDDDAIQIPGSTITHATASDKCARFDASGVLVPATGNCAAGAATSWIDLTDTDPSTLVGQAGKFVNVNAGETGLELDDLVDGDLPAEVPLTDETNTFSAVQTFTGNPVIQGANPVLTLDQTDAGDVLLDLQASTLRFSGTNLFAKFDVAAPLNSLVLASSGRLGLGTAAPSSLFHAFVTTGTPVATIESDDDFVTWLADGVQAASDGVFAQLQFNNAGDSIATIQGYRVTDDFKGRLIFAVQETSVGGMVARFTLDPTDARLYLPLVLGGDVDGGSSYDLANMVEGEFEGALTAGSISVPAHATDGQYVLLLEGTDDAPSGAGTEHSYTLKVPDTGLDADKVCTLTALGTFAPACVDQAGAWIWSGTHDYGDATSLEIVNGASPTVNAAGEIAIDSDGVASELTQGFVTYYDGTQQMYGLATDATPTAAEDNYVAKYDAALDKWVLEADLQGGGGALDDVSDVTITTPATGAVLIKGAGDWVDGQVDLADADAVTGLLPDANIVSTIARDSELHAAATVSGTYDYITLSGQDIVRGQIDLSTDVTGTLDETLVDSDLATDSEVNTAIAAQVLMENIAIPDPATTDSGDVQLQFGAAATITEVRCSTDVGTATIQFDERVETTPNTGGTDVLTAQLVCDTDSQSTTSFANAGIAATATMNLDVDAVATTPGVVRIHVYYTIP